MKTSSTIRALPRRATELFAALLLVLHGQAAAHEGHHHDEPQPSAVSAAPVAADAVPRIEAVAQREGGDIVLYLDDYASNAPLDGLQVSVRSGTLTLQAAGGEGRYRIPADLLGGQDAQPLAVSVHGAGFDAALEVELPAAAPPAAPPPASSLLPRLASAALILGLLGAAWLLRRRRGADAGREARTA
ncbi:MAG TPA: hypothetical protein VFA75_05610 [Nevskia sp.]|nr:hypothetical protein [Nevskia sp.]